MNRYKMARFLIKIVYLPVFMFLAKTPKSRMGVWLYSGVLVPLYELDCRVHEACMVRYGRKMT